MLWDILTYKLLFVLMSKRRCTRKTKWVKERRNWMEKEGENKKIKKWNKFYIKKDKMEKIVEETKYAFYKTKKEIHITL